jgi:hypothetical protein
MGEGHGLRTEELRRLEEELVPLSVAATVTYFHVTAVDRQVEDQSNLFQVLHLVAVALSQLAPIHEAHEDGSPGPLSAQEVERLLFRPIRNGSELPDLDRFRMRRGDLHRAMNALREARSAFGRVF